MKPSGGSASADRRILRVERRFCQHCDEYVSFKTYRAHKRLYYLPSSGQWISKASSSGTATDIAGSTVCEAAPTSFGESVTSQENEEGPPDTSYVMHGQGRPASRS